MLFPPQNIEFDSSGFSLRTPEIDLNPKLGIAIIGTNGSGKSTWSKSVAGLLKAGNPAAEKWFYIPQSMEQFFFAETLPEQLKYLFPEGYSVGRLNALFQQFKLEPEKMDEYPLRWLSGGERRRVALACALYIDPANLILDEPTIGLSPKEALVIKTLLDNLTATLNGLIIITHELDVIRERKQVLGFETGKIVYQGSTEELVQSKELIDRFGIRSIRAAD